ncbi:MAG TPA: DUF6754 domain-containing protein [Bacillota bacterium]|jgi:hypothetical protein
MTGGIFVPGLAAQFLLVGVFGAIVYVMIRRTRAGRRVAKIRKIPGLEAVEEAVGRATEMGRPVHMTYGLGDIDDASTFAFWGMLGHVARLCARYETRLLQTNNNYLVMAINEEVIRQAYAESGRPDAYRPEDVRFLSPWQFGYASAVLGIFQRERPAANIMIGTFLAESLIFAEAGHAVGAVQIAGTANTSQLPFFMAACDFCLLGEEIYAASAYLSRDPVLTGSVVGQDLAKIFLLGLVILGTLVENGWPHNWFWGLLSR